MAGADPAPRRPTTPITTATSRSFIPSSLVGLGVAFLTPNALLTRESRINSLLISILWPQKRTGLASGAGSGV